MTVHGLALVELVDIFRTAVPHGDVVHVDP
ncbi:hypothetical protein RKD54_003917 [Pseudarthrobacter sp. SLBN-100]